MKCEKCGAKVNPNNYCSICGEKQQPENEIDETDTSAFFARFNEMQGASSYLNDLPKVKKITIGSSDIDVRFGFAVIAILLVIAFFMPFYHITTDIYGTRRTPIYNDDGEAGGIDVQLTEVKETPEGNITGWQIARSSRTFTDDVFWGLLLIPVLMLIALIASRNRLNAGNIYRFFLWGFNAGISLLVFEYLWFFYDVTRIMNTSVYNSRAVRISGLIHGDEFIFAGDLAKITLVLPTIGWVVSAILYFLGCLLAMSSVKKFSSISNSKGKI